MSGGWRRPQILTFEDFIMDDTLRRTLCEMFPEIMRIDERTQPSVDSGIGVLPSGTNLQVSPAGAPADWPAKPKSLRRQMAGAINARLRRPWGSIDRQRLRQQCLERKPWQSSTGPRTLAGKLAASANGGKRKSDAADMRST